MTIQELAEILSLRGLSLTIRHFHGVWRVDLRTSATDLPAGGALAASLSEALEAALKKT